MSASHPVILGRASLVAHLRDHHDWDVRRMGTTIDLSPDKYGWHRRDGGYEASDADLFVIHRELTALSGAGPALHREEEAGE